VRHLPRLAKQKEGEESLDLFFSSRLRRRGGKGGRNLMRRRLEKKGKKEKGENLLLSNLENVEGGGEEGGER